MNETPFCSDIIAQEQRQISLENIEEEIIDQVAECLSASGLNGFNNILELGISAEKWNKFRKNIARIIVREFDVTERLP